MGAFGDVVPDGAKKLYPEPVFSSEEEGISAFAEMYS